MKTIITILLCMILAACGKPYRTKRRPVVYNLQVYEIGGKDYGYNVDNACWYVRQLTPLPATTASSFVTPTGAKWAKTTPPDEAHDLLQESPERIVQVE